MTGTEGFCANDLVADVATPAIRSRTSRRLARLCSVTALELVHLMATIPLPSPDCQSIALNAQTILDEVAQASGGQALLQTAEGYPEDRNSFVESLDFAVPKL